MDSARSWRVAASCCWMSSFGFIMIRSSGIIYVNIIEWFQVSREEASWPVTLPTNTYMLSGLLASIIARYVDTWKVTLTGCLLGCISVCACFFANEILHLTLLLGIVYGAGISVLRLNTMVVNQHFIRYRAAASGINMAGNSISGFVFPPMVQYFSTYGLRGTFLLSGALMLNSVAGSILQRASPAPRQDIDSKSTRGRSIKGKISKTCSNLIPDTTSDDEENNRIRGCSSVPTSKHEHRHDGRVTCSPEATTGPRNIQPDCEDCSGTAVCDVFLPVSNGSGGHSEPIRSDLCNGLVPLNGKTAHSRCYVENVTQDSERAQAKLFLSFLVSPMFYLVMFTQTVIAFNMTSYLTVIVDFAVDRGISKWNSVFLLSSYTLVDLAARLGSGWITDRHVFSRSTWTAMNFLLWAVSFLVIPVCDNYYYQIVMSVAAGWCNGSTLTLIPVLLMDIVELPQYGVCYGISSFAVGLLGFVRPSLIGYYRDKLGDYEGLFFLLGEFTLVLAFLWMCASAYEAYGHRKNGRCVPGCFREHEKDELKNRHVRPS